MTGSCNRRRHSDHGCSRWRGCRLDPIEMTSALRSESTKARRKAEKCMLEEQHPDAVLVSPSGEAVLGHEAPPRAHTSKTSNTDMDRQGRAALTVSAVHLFGEGNGAEPAGSRAPLSDEALDTVQGG